MTNNNVLLQVDNLQKKYYLKKGLFADKSNYIKAVDNVSIRFPRFHSIGLVGESGCGKSTFGKALLRLIEPTGGRVTFEDKLLFDTDAGTYLPEYEMNRLRREITMIFQDPYSSLNPHMTVGNAVQEGVCYHKVVPKEESMDYTIRMLESCGMDGSAFHKYPVEFSGGQRQRVVIARALALRPKFVVCDEPTAALDVSIQSQILNLMLDLKEELNLTYLFISHNLGVTRAFCDETAVMYLGHIVEYGPSDEVFSHSLHPYTRALVASLPISTPDQPKPKVELLDSIPSMLHIPAGCRFHTRCPYATEKCRCCEPELREIAPGHQVACHLFEN